MLKRRRAASRRPLLADEPVPAPHGRLALAVEREPATRLARRVDVRLGERTRVEHDLTCVEIMWHIRNRRLNH